MKTTQRLTGLALAMLLTLSMLGGIDRLAHTEFTAATAPARPGRSTSTTSSPT